MLTLHVEDKCSTSAGERCMWSRLRMSSSPAARRELSYSWGYLFFDEPPLSVEKAWRLVQSSRFGKTLILVGDVVSKSFRERGLGDFFIVDGHTRRNLKVEDLPGKAEAFTCKNRPGEISRECYELLRNLLTSAIGRGKKIVVYVEGEEDLLSLVALLYCPLNDSWVIYGNFRGYLEVIPCTSFFRSVAENLLVKHFEKD